MADNNRQVLRRFVLLLVGMGWLGTSLAAVLAAPTTLLELPWAQILVGCVISLWGGLARTATRVLDAQRAGTPIVLWHELAKDLMSASLVGFVTFGISAWQAWNVWLLAVLLPLAGFGGARFLEPMADAAVARLSGALGNRKEAP